MAKESWRRLRNVASRVGVCCCWAWPLVGAPLPRRGEGDDAHGLVLGPKVVVDEPQFDRRRVARDRDVERGAPFGVERLPRDLRATRLDAVDEENR